MKSLNFQPQLQTLEDRLNPAQIYWVGEYSSDTTNPNNWWDEYLQPALPGPSDHVFFIPHELPTNDPYSDESGVFVSYPADNFHGSFHSVTLALGYESVVTLDGSLYLQDFHMNDGTIRQPSSSYEINAFSWFTWTNGTINDTATLGELYVASGATVEIEPRDGGTVATGTTLNLGGFGIQAAVEGSIGKGTIEFSNGADLNVNEYASVHVNIAVDETLTLKLSPGMNVAGVSIITVKDAGSLKVIQGTFQTNDIPLWVAGGDVIVRTNATLDVSGKLSFLGFGQASVYMTAGSIKLWQGILLGPPNHDFAAVLKVEHGLQISGPDAILYTIADPVNYDYIEPPVIEGNLKMTDGSIQPLGLLTTRREPANQLLNGSIEIKGSFDWEGGTYIPYVQWDDDLDSAGDKILVRGQVTITRGPGNAKLKPGVYYSDGTLHSKPIRGLPLYQWFVIGSTREINYIGSGLTIIGDWRFVSPNQQNAHLLNIESDIPTNP